MGEKITFNRPDGKGCTGYYITEEGGEKASGIVVIQEWWGLNDQIKGVANRLAKAGYRVLVPDLYRGEVTLEAAEAEHLMTHLDFVDAATQDIRGAVQHLKKISPKVAVIGFCMGGALSILAAVHVKEADAVSCWYGIPPEEAADPRAIKVPLQGHFALKDLYFTPAQVDALEVKLKESHKEYEFYRYRAKHAFGNETGGNYEPEAARLAWERTLSFFARHLK
jgi:carboxymethylenebutenolidase